MAADPGDALKLGEAFRDLMAEADYERDMQSLAREQKWTEAIARIDRQIDARKPEGEALQAALLFRAGFETKAGDKETASATLQRVIEIDKESGPAKEAARLRTKLAE